jgi:Ribosomal protein L7/L12 C-terminal domain
LNATVLFDVRVLGWRSAGAGTVAALQEVFGLDLDTATQLVSRVPAAVKRGVSSSEAQTFMRALQGVGAQVVLVRTGAPVTIDAPNPALANTPARYLAAESQPIAVTPPAAPTTLTGSRVPAPPAPPSKPASGPMWSGTGSLASMPRPTGQTYRGPSPAPRPSPPMSRPVSQPMASHGDLDLIGNDGRRRSPSGPLDGGPLFPDVETGSARMRKAGGQRELDLSASSAGQPRLDIERAELPMPAGLPALTEMSPVERFGHESGRARSRPVAEPESKPGRKAPSGGATEAAPKATPPRKAPSPAPAGPSKLVGVRQVLVGVSVFVIGLLLDDSVLRGGATPISVALHGIGFYQLGLGLRRLFS